LFNSELLTVGLLPFQLEFCFSVNQDVYVSKETFLPSGYGFPMTKGSYLLTHVNKW
jgi:hypothetical protein